MNGTGRRPRVHPLIAGFIAGVLIAGVIGLMATINLQYGAPWASTHTVTAQVTDADSMAVGSDVRIGGRLVGQVVSIRSAGDHTDITFHVDDGDWPLPADTTASVRLATLLGQKYIQLNPGTSSNHLADNAVLTVQRTKPVVDFDQILDTFNKPTRDALTQLIRTAAGAVQGQEGTLQQLLPDFSDLSVHSQIPTGELQTRDPEINAILINLGITATQLDTSRNDLAAVIDSFNSINATLASNEGAALKGYITNGDTINQTTDAVLRGGSASKLATGLQQVGTFVSYLNQLLTSLIPQTQTFTSKDPLAEPSDLINSGGVPSKASIDLIYEIGSATSQGYGSTSLGNGNDQGNFWLRQSAAGIDPCGLIESLVNTGALGCPLSSSLPSAPAQSQTTPTPPQQGGHLPVCVGPICNLPPICVPLPNVPCITPPPIPTPCVSLPALPTPSPSLGIPLPTLAPCTSSPTPAPTQSQGGGILPTLPPLPTPSLPLGLGQVASDTLQLGDAGAAAAVFPVKER